MPQWLVDAAEPRAALIATIAAVCVAVLLVAIGAWCAIAWKRRTMLERFDAGRAAEREAEFILAAAGFRVIARQISARWTMTVDGTRCEVDLRADLRVERHGRQWLVEVKSGAAAPDPLWPSTRRQLLEYSLAFGASELLLVDVTARRIHVVSFPDLEFASAAAWVHWADECVPGPMKVRAGR